MERPIAVTIPIIGINGKRGVLNPYSTVDAYNLLIVIDAKFTCVNKNRNITLAANAIAVKSIDTARISMIIPETIVATNGVLYFG